MQTAYVDAASICFPPKCPHCGAKPERTYAVAAMRNLDLLFGEYTVPRLIDVPVCGAAYRRRRRWAAMALVFEVSFIVAAGFVALTLALDGAPIRASLAAGAAVALALSGRTGWDEALLDRWILGLSARCAPASRVRIRVAGDAYFSEWMAVNPSASVHAGVLGWRPEPRAEAAPDFALMSSRKLPAIVLAVTLPVIALHHWNAASGGEVFLVGLSLMMAVAFLASGGLVYPPIFWSIGAYGKHLKTPYRVAGALIAIAGLVAGFLLGISYGRR